MSFFKRNKNEIPPPPSYQQQPNVLSKQRPSDGGSSGGGNSYQGGGSYQQGGYQPQPQRQVYNQSRDGLDPYSQGGGGRGEYGNRTPSPQPPPEPDRFARSRQIGDPYSRAGAGNVDADRSELFAGYNPDKAGNGKNRFDDRGGGGGNWQDRTPQSQQEEEEDVETIKADTRKLKNESVNSTRNALRIAREAEEAARATLELLGDQSARLGNTQRLLDQSKSNTTRAEDKTYEIKQLNKSIFNPAAAFTINKDAKRAKQEARLAERYANEQEEREEAMREIRDSQNRIGKATSYGQRSGDDAYGEENPSGSMYGRKPRTQEQLAGRRRFQFEKSASDDELEDELDDNLDEIHGVTKNLKALAVAQGEELKRQNDRLNKMNNNATNLGNQLDRATRNLKKL